MIFFILGVILISNVNAAEQKVFVLTLKYNEGLVSFDKIFATKGIFNEQLTPMGEYRLEILSFNDEVLYSERFDFDLEVFLSAPSEWFDENGIQIYIPNESETGTVLTETTKELIIPYFINAKTINIYNPEEKILEIPVGHFADLCGDNICQPHESYESCPIDCPSGSADDYCDRIADNICDPDCSAEQDVDCEEKKPNTLAIIISLTFLLIIIIFAYLEFNRLKYHKNLKVNYKEERLNDMREYIQTNLRRGYKKEGIRNALIKIGYNNEEIEEAFRRLR
jgi:hypothetical protein